VIGEPPSANGADHDTATCWLPAIPETPVGAVGTVRGVTGALGSEGRDVPAELVAVTVKVYEVPFVSPVIVQVRAPVVAQV
jgi:hypothetical protein